MCVDGGMNVEITERKENPILNRIELSWQWRHTGEPTPTRAKIIEALAKMEPGATKDRIIIKSVDTRFGQPLTSGSAFVYGDQESLEKEPKYILERHAVGADDAEQAPSAPTESEEPTAEDVEIAGGEE
tara:strand:+ start:59 stop:445 length:387 start_codon:yes stop_codon:yes gene_type:complete